VSTIPQSELNERLAAILAICQKMNSERDLGALLDLIAREATSLLDCDRASIFLLDRERNELWSKVALGSDEILRFDARLGIAGSTVMTGRAINVRDAYGDPRFYTAIDGQTGYRTRSVLAVAMHNQGGEIIGAFEALNKAAGPFTQRDEESLAALASHAAIAIETAQLIGELRRSQDELVEQNTNLWREVESKYSSHGIIGTGPRIQQVVRLVERIRDSLVSVLITGESGTGKELAAIAVHRFSSRRDAPLVCLNCAAIPDSLVESELFGYEKGAFTGADSSREGKIAAADQGVIFLDEIGDLSLFAQAKILRAVETKEIYRLGSQNPTRVNVRIVTATHRNLEQMVTAGKFRQDLFFRLNIGRIHIPPLRERIEDLGILVSHYLREINRQMGTTVRGLTDAAWHILTTYAWPGNIRELRNVVESALVNATSEVIDTCDLPPHLSMATVRDLSPRERDRLVEALLATRWNKTQAAQRLHWSRMTLYRKMAKYAVSSSAQATV
jgi:Nif-specific regulatory protein